MIVNGVADKLHTGAVATPLWPNQPAPMDGTDWRLGVPSSNWFVLGFEEP